MLKENEISLRSITLMYAKKAGIINHTVMLQGLTHGIIGYDIINSTIKLVDGYLEN